MDFRYLKLGFQSFIIVVLIGGIFVYLKAQNIIPPIVRLDNFEYKQTLIQKNISFVKISYKEDKAIIKVKDFYVYGIAKLTFPLDDFKRKGKNFFYDKSVGLKGVILPVYIDLFISNIKPVNTYEFSIPQSEINEYINLNKKRIIKNLGTFIYIKDFDRDCGIVNMENKEKAIVCNIKRDINVENKLTEGLYLVSPLSVIKLDGNIKSYQVFSEKNYEILKDYMEGMILSDLYLERNISDKIKDDFINFVKTIFKLKKFNIREINFETKG